MSYTGRLISLISFIGTLSLSTGYIGIAADALSLDDLRQAAERAEPEAQYSLGLSYSLGRGVPEDARDAVKWFRLSAEQGYAKAQHNLGVCYRDGDGVARNYTEAVKWFRLAADQGFAASQLNLGARYEYGQGVGCDLAEALKWYRQAAEQGLGEAQLNVGCFFAEGRGIQQDWEEAVKWFGLAAEQGVASAQFYLAQCYYLGNGVSQDYMAAVKWWKEAAGHAYVDSFRDTPEPGGDKVKYQVAAEPAIIEALFNLGLCYANGEGIVQDWEEAMKLFGKAAALGHPDADEAAIDAIVLAAKQGDVKAQRTLGSLYAEGQGVAQDYAEAGRWYLLATEQGDWLSRLALEELIETKRLTK